MISSIKPTAKSPWKSDGLEYVGIWFISFWDNTLPIFRRKNLLLSLRPVFHWGNPSWPQKSNTKYHTWAIDPGSSKQPSLISKSHWRLMVGRLSFPFGAPPSIPVRLLLVSGKGNLEDHPSDRKSPKNRVVGPLPNGRTPWLPAYKFWDDLPRMSPEN